MIDEFRSRLIARGLMATTIDRYCRWVERFLSWCDEWHQSFSPREMEAFLQSDLVKRRRDGGVSATATQNDARAALRALGRWVTFAGHVPENPAKGIGFLKAEGTRRARPLNWQEIQLIVRGPVEEAFPERVSILVNLLLTTGIRLAEALSRNVWDYQSGEGFLSVQRAKGGDMVRFPLAPKTMCGLDVLTLGRRPSEPIFRTRAGARLSARTAQADFRRWCLSLGYLEENAPRIHDLRRTFAEGIYRGSGCDLLLTSVAMGHGDVRTTARYLNCLPVSVEAVVREFSASVHAGFVGGLGDRGALVEVLPLRIPRQGPTL